MLSFTTILIPLIVVVVVLYVVITIVGALIRRRLRLRQEAEDEQSDAPRRRRNAGRKSPTRLGQSPVAPTSHEVEWLNTWLTEEFPTIE